jgi:hypothetical protein
MKKELILRLSILFAVLIIVNVAVILRLINVHGTTDYRLSFVVFPILILLSIYIFIRQHKWAIESVSDTWSKNIIGVDEWKDTKNLISIKEIFNIIIYFTNFYITTVSTFYFIIVMTFDHELDIKIIFIGLVTAIIVSVVLQSLYEDGLRKKLLSFVKKFYERTLTGKYYNLFDFLNERKSKNLEYLSQLQKKYDNLQKAFINIPKNENSEIEKKVSLTRMFMEEIKIFNERFESGNSFLILKQIPAELKEFRENFTTQESNLKLTLKDGYDSSEPNSIHSSFPKGFHDFHPKSLKLETQQKLDKLDYQTNRNYYFLDNKLIDSINEL